MNKAREVKSCNYWDLNPYTGEWQINIHRVFPKDPSEVRNDRFYKQAIKEILDEADAGRKLRCDR